MQRLFVAFIVLINFTALPLFSPAQNVQGEFQFENNEASISFPESVTFKAKITAPSEIEHIVLEYYTEQISCGKVIAKGFPVFDPATSVEVEWTWEMLQSGSIPTGAKIHWQWRVKTVNGEEGVSPEQTITWLDSIHPWENISDERVSFNWYSGGEEFGSELHSAALTALDTIEKQIGLKTSNPIEIYIYANNQDFQEALLYEAGWTGGVALPEYGIVLIGIDPVDLEWGKSTIAHEITHVLQGQYSFTCLGSSPTWLVEGIAMYAEGGLDDYSKETFKTAIKDDTLYSVRALSGSFSESSTCC